MRDNIGLPNLDVPGSNPSDEEDLFPGLTAMVDGDFELDPSNEGPDQFPGLTEMFPPEAPNAFQEVGDTHGYIHSAVSTLSDAADNFARATGRGADNTIFYSSLAAELYTNQQLGDVDTVWQLTLEASERERRQMQARSNEPSIDSTALLNPDISVYDLSWEDGVGPRVLPKLAEHFGNYFDFEAVPGIVGEAVGQLGVQLPVIFGASWAGGKAGGAIGGGVGTVIAPGPGTALGAAGGATVGTATGAVTAGGMLAGMQSYGSEYINRTLELIDRYEAEGKDPELYRNEIIAEATEVANGAFNISATIGALSAGVLTKLPGFKRLLSHKSGPRAGEIARRREWGAQVFLEEADTVANNYNADRALTDGVVETLIGAGIAEALIPAGGYAKDRYLRRRNARATDGGTAPPLAPRTARNPGTAEDDETVLETTFEMDTRPGLTLSRDEYVDSVIHNLTTADNQKRAADDTYAGDPAIPVVADFLSHLLEEVSRGEAASQITDPVERNSPVNVGMVRQGQEAKALLDMLREPMVTKPATKTFLETKSGQLLPIARNQDGTPKVDYGNSGIVIATLADGTQEVVSRGGVENATIVSLEDSTAYNRMFSSKFRAMLRRAQGRYKDIISAEVAQSTLDGQRGDVVGDNTTVNIKGRATTAADADQGIDPATVNVDETDDLALIQDVGLTDNLTQSANNQQVLDDQGISKLLEAAEYHLEQGHAALARRLTDIAKTHSEQNAQSATQTDDLRSELSQLRKDRGERPLDPDKPTESLEDQLETVSLTEFVDTIDDAEVQTLVKRIVSQMMSSKYGGHENVDTIGVVDLEAFKTVLRRIHPDAPIDDKIEGVSLKNFFSAQGNRLRRHAIGIPRDKVNLNTARTLAHELMHIAAFMQGWDRTTFAQLWRGIEGTNDSLKDWVLKNYSRGDFEHLSEDRYVSMLGEEYLVETMARSLVGRYASAADTTGYIGQLLARFMDNIRYAYDEYIGKNHIDKLFSKMSKAVDELTSDGSQDVLSDELPQFRRRAPTAPDISATPAFSRSIEYVNPFHSYQEETITRLGEKQKKAKGSQWLGMLKKQGVKADELVWTGLEEYLNDNANDTLTVDELLEAHRQGAVRIEPYVIGGKGHVNTADSRAIQMSDSEWLDLTDDDVAIYEERVREDIDDGTLDGFDLDEDFDGDENARDEAIQDKAQDLAENDWEGREQQAFLVIRGEQTEYRVTWRDRDYGEYYLSGPDKLDGGYKYIDEVSTFEDAQHTLLEAYAEDNDVDLSTETQYDDWTLSGGDNYAENLFVLTGDGVDGSNYDNPHFDQHENIIAHTRTTDRVVDGERVLFIEEVQSDWHADGRDNGYKGVPDQNGVPQAPFKSSWVEMVLKAMLVKAAREGYKRLAWSTGDIQKDRYNLWKHVERVEWHSGDQKVLGYRNASDTNPIEIEGVTERNLAQKVGSEVARQILSRYQQPLPGLEQVIYEVRGENNIGGSSKNTLYDQQVPNTLRKILRKFDKRVGFKEVDLGVTYGQPTKTPGDGGMPIKQDRKRAIVNSVEITDSLRERVKDTLPLFSRRADDDYVANMSNLTRFRGRLKSSNELVDHRIRHRDLAAIDAAMARPAFDRWFGNSKVSSNDGHPVQVYHWSKNNDFESVNAGTHFGTTTAATERSQMVYLGERGISWWLKGDRNAKLEEAARNTEGRIIAGFLSIQNPMLLTDSGLHDPIRIIDVALGKAGLPGRGVAPELTDQGALEELREKFATEVKELRLREENAQPALANRLRPTQWQRLSNELMRQGIDGIAYINGVEDEGSVSWVILDPRQFKSTFNPFTEDSVDDIRFSRNNADTHLSFEAVPSTTATNLPGYWFAPYDVKAEFARAVKQNVVLPILADWGLDEASVSTVPGGYSLETNPALRGSTRQLTWEAATELAAALGYVLKQDSVLVTHPDFQNGTSEMTSIVAPSGYWTPARSHEFFLHLGESVSGYQVSEDGDESRFIVYNLADDGTQSLAGEAWINEVERSATSWNDDVSLVIEKDGQGPIKTQAEFVRNDWKDQPNGEGYRSSVQSRDVSKDFRREVARYQTILRQFTERYRWDRSPFERGSDGNVVETSTAGSFTTPVSVGGPGGLDPSHTVAADVLSRFGKLAGFKDTTDNLKIYPLDAFIENESRLDRLKAMFGATERWFSFHEDVATGVTEVLPQLKKFNYANHYVQIYNPKVAHGSFKDELYTRVWRVSHELAHGVTEAVVQEKYGDSRREGRLGAPHVSQRGTGTKKIDFEVPALTLAEAQRAVEWEDLAFRAQRMILQKFGVELSDQDFAREYNINMADAVYRTLTGDFSDPGELGFVPSTTKVQLSDVLGLVERAEHDLAARQRRTPTKGRKDGWVETSDDKLQALVDRAGYENQIIPSQSDDDPMFSRRSNETLSEYTRGQWVGKEGTITDVGSADSAVLVNPTRPSFIELLQRSSNIDALRYVVDELGNVFLWDSSKLSQTELLDILEVGPASLEASGQIRNRAHGFEIVETLDQNDGKFDVAAVETNRVAEAMQRLRQDLANGERTTSPAQRSPLPAWLLQLQKYDIFAQSSVGNIVRLGKHTKAARTLANLVHRNKFAYGADDTGRIEDEGYHRAMDAAGAKFATPMTRGLNKLSKKGTTQLAKVLRGGFGVNPNTGAVRIPANLDVDLGAAAIIKQTLNDLYDYWRAAMIEGGAEQDSIPRKIPNYFPQRWLVRGEFGTEARPELRGLPRSVAVREFLLNMGLGKDDPGVVDAIVGKMLGEDGDIDWGFDAFAMFDKTLSEKISSEFRRVLNFKGYESTTLRYEGKDYFVELSDLLDNDVLTVLPNHVNNMTKRAEFARRFGHDGSQIAEYLDAIDSELEANDEAPLTQKDRDKILDHLRANFGLLHRSIKQWYGGHLYTAMKGVRFFGDVIMLPLTTLTSVPEFGMPLVRMGLIPQVSSLQQNAKDILNLPVQHAKATAAAASRGGGVVDRARVYRQVLGESKAEMRMIAEDVLGTVLPSIHHVLMDHVEQSQFSKLDRARQVYFKGIGLQWLTDVQRTGATAAAITAIGRWGKKAQKGNRQALRWLNEVGLTLDDLSEFDHRNFLDTTNEQVNKAVRQMVDETIMNPSPGDKPSWMSDPAFILASHIKSFITTFGNTVLVRGGRELGHGNPMPLLYIGLYAGLAALVYEFREWFRWGEEGNPYYARIGLEKDDPWRRFYIALERGGVAAGYQFLMDMFLGARIGREPDLVGVMAPSLGPATQAIQGTSNLLTGMISDDDKLVKRGVDKLTRSTPILNQTGQFRVDARNAIAETLTE